MISVIIPVYNIEPYLRKCLDSVVNQTYKELEILIIDDGSTDGSGAICDEYAKTDKRIRVFHTENRGLSCARNLGLDEAKGEWIGFVDSDDWIEPNMYECLLRRAEETGADVVECGCYREQKRSTQVSNRQNMVMSGMEAVIGLMHRELSEEVWNKLYRSICFSQLRFPENRTYEDVAITYKVLLEASKVSTISENQYHHIKRVGSLSATHDMKNLIGYWKSVKERYDNLFSIVDVQERRDLLKSCAIAASRTWVYYFDCSVEERRKNNCVIHEINSFTKQNIRLFGDNEWNYQLRIGVFFPHFLNAVSFRIAWLMNRLVKKIT